MSVVPAQKIAPRAGPPINGFQSVGVRAEGPCKEIGFIGRRYLLALSRMAVEHALATGQALRIEPWEAPSPDIMEERACFVTIYAAGKLRGCIGSLEPQRPLVHDAILNALRSAFHDERFQPLTPAELGHVTFSISVLGKPSRLLYSGPEDLMSRLEPGRHGLILSKGASMATYLPHVWRTFPTKAEFLSNLCVKAGLEAGEWKKAEGVDIFAYEAQEFSERPA